MVSQVDLWCWNTLCKRSHLSGFICTWHSSWYKWGTVYSLEKCQGKVVVHFILLTVTRCIMHAQLDSTRAYADEKVKVHWYTWHSVTKAHTLHSILWVAHNNNHPCLLWGLVNVGVRPQWSTVMITKSPHRARDRHYKRRNRNIWWKRYKNRDKIKWLEWRETI